MKLYNVYFLVVLPIVASFEETCNYDVSFTGENHSKLPFVEHFDGWVSNNDILPLPPSFFFDIIKENPEEPIFDPNIHLDLEMPKKVALTDTFELQTLNESGVPRVNGEATGSQLAYTDVFKFLSNEGIRVLKDIVERDTDFIRKNHRNLAYRGMYYRSPFCRALTSSPVVLNFFEKIYGEPVLPFFNLMTSPVVNIAFPDDTISVADPWHIDSVTYIGVSVLSDMTDMIGGELQFMKYKKEKALSILSDQNHILNDEEMVTVHYKAPGYMICAHGSEVFHRVKSVLSSKEPRLSLVMSFQPANSFQADKHVLDTWRRFDSDLDSADFEFYRGKAHQLGGALKHLAAHEQPTKNGTLLATRLRAITAELDRVASLLDGSTNDFIGFVKG